MAVELAVVAVLALLCGVVLGWLLRSGPMAAAAARADAAAAQAGELPPLRLMIDGLRQERDAAARALAGAQERAARVDALTDELETHRARADALAIDRAALAQGQAERETAHAREIAQLKEMETRLSARFNDLAGQALGDAQDRFLKRAEDRFRQSEEVSGDRLKALLQPVSDRLTRYEEGVARAEAERRDAFGALTGLIDSMRIGQERVSSEAARLVNSLRAAPKARGRWGEQQLRNVLETCGLSEHCDFRTEVSVEGEDGRLRPDVVVNVPGGRTLVIDAKVSLNAFQDAYGAVDEGERARHLAAHAAAMRAHVTELGSRAYQKLFADTADYVVMFVPGEHFLTAALDQDAKLWDWAFNQRVLLATPTNLIAIARTVAAVWRQERLADDARRIGELGREMHDRLAVASEHLKDVGGGLSRAVDRYNRFVGSFERNVMSTGRKLRDLNIETPAKTLPELAPVEAQARYDDPAPPALPAAAAAAAAAE